LQKLQVLIIAKNKFGGFKKVFVTLGGFRGALRKPIKT
jgi:hypothetical protein